MTDLYTAVCMQMNRVGIDHRKEIRKANLDRCLEIFGYGAHSRGPCGSVSGSTRR